MDEDMKWRDERHQRQLSLMREMGKVNRQGNPDVHALGCRAILTVLALLGVGMAS